jgi:predicted nucleic acid-binding protein
VIRITASAKTPGPSVDLIVTPSARMKDVIDHWSVEETSVPRGSAPFTPAADMQGAWSFTADPKLPNVLILGDSISIGYTRMVREKLTGKANVHYPMRGKGPDNSGDTTIGLKNIDGWLGQQKWDVIHFNWGLWDLCYRNPQSKVQGNRDKAGGKISTPPADYEKNLERLVTRLEATGAKLIWANTTVVPEDEVGRFVGDDAKYNAIAARVMKQHGIATDDLFTLSKQFCGKFSVKPGDVHFTNVLCESSKPQPAASVLQWLADHDAELAISALSLGEMLKGIHLMDRGKRRLKIESWCRRIERWASGRVLPVDSAVIHTWASFYAKHQRAGRKLPAMDSLIAATALQHQLTLVTRNTDDFPHDVPIFNPWTAP